MIEITPKPFQARFLRSKVRFPAIVSGVATGKTFMGLLKVWQFCEQYPDSLALILRNEFSDLRDSTVQDFKRYFSVDIDSNKSYSFPNKSVILFRHGSEMNTLRNVNASCFLLEQAEEFPTDEQFNMLRDRLRRTNAPLRQGIVIANSNGHNWVWKNWINQAKEVKEIDSKTGQYQYLSEDFDCVTANSFVNADVLPEDFVKDLKRMEKDAPSHFSRYVMNSFEDEISDDLVFPIIELENARKVEFSLRAGYGHRILACDPARFGQDTTAVVIIQQMGSLNWEVIHLEEWQGKDAVYTVGRCNEIAAKNRCDSIIIDCDGLGGPLSDFMRVQSSQNITEFRNLPYSFEQNPTYGNRRTEAAFKTKEMIVKGFLKITDEKIIQELNSAFFFKYTTKGQRILRSKDELRKDGIASPNAADAVLYAVSMIEDIQNKQNRQYAPRHKQAPEENLFKIAGIR